MKCSVVTALVICCALVVQATDRFDKIKTDLAEAGCVQLEFLSILESDVFDTIDTANGLAYIADDGRFRLRLGEDVYIDDGTERYSYVPENEQIIIEPSGVAEADQISFLIRIDDHYRTSLIESNRCYRLDLIDSTLTGLPELMTIWITSDEDRIERLEYEDINGDLNRFVLTRQVLDSICDESRFVPDFDDSIERVRIP
ncbi:MAG TPA: outer membrane lipoprotein carrier protein LolA [candidate division Zixibacteria bacterium]|nr:outer membrane lipoprotein carrier protein LolA [candidate division Zixibacteria bacterium]